MRRNIILASTLLAISVATPAFAQQASSSDTGSGMTVPRTWVTVGVAGGLLPDYEGSNDYRLAPLPAAIGKIDGFGFSVIGDHASLNLIRGQSKSGLSFELGPVASINLNRTDHKSIDDPRVSVLPERGTAVELGAYAGVSKAGVITSPYDQLSVSVSYRHDVNGVYHSGVWEPSVTYLTPLSTKAAVALFGSVEHIGRGYAQTYYGVTPNDSLLSGLPVYSAHAGWSSYSLGAAFTYSLTGNLLHGLKLVAGGTYTRELDTASYTPLTRIAGSPSQWLGAVGLAYTF